MVLFIREKKINDIRIFRSIESVICRKKKDAEGGNIKQIPGSSTGDGHKTVLTGETESE